MHKSSIKITQILMQYTFFFFLIQSTDYKNVNEISPCALEQLWQNRIRTMTVLARMYSATPRLSRSPTTYKENKKKTSTHIRVTQSLGRHRMKVRSRNNIQRASEFLFLLFFLKFDNGHKEKCFCSVASTVRCSRCNRSLRTGFGWL